MRHANEGFDVGEVGVREACRLSGMSCAPSGLSARVGGCEVLGQRTHCHLGLLTEDSIISLPSYNALDLALAVLVQHDIERHARLDEGELGELASIVDGEDRGLYGWGEE